MKTIIHHYFYSLNPLKIGFHHYLLFFIFPINLTHAAFTYWIHHINASCDCLTLYETYMKHAPETELCCVTSNGFKVIQCSKCVNIIVKQRSSNLKDLELKSKTECVVTFCGFETSVHTWVRWCTLHLWLPSAIRKSWRTFTNSTDISN